MATRRWCRNRIKRRPLSERQRVSDASRFRRQRRVQSAQRTAIVGVAFFAYFFGEAKKQVGRRAETRPASTAGQPQRFTSVQAKQNRRAAIKRQTATTSPSTAPPAKPAKREQGSQQRTSHPTPSPPMRLRM